MKKQPALSLLFCIFFLSIISGCSTRAGSDKSSSSSPTAVLVFSKTSGFYHKSIPDGIAAIQKLGMENNFRVDTTKNAAYFVADSLSKYGAIIFLSTTGDVLNREQEMAFEEYIKNGGGFVGIHAASDTEYDWAWYTKLVGAQFLNHPEIQEADVIVVDKDHPATHFLPDTWHRKDEWYNLKNISPELNILARLDENSYTGGTNGENHPIAWYHEFEGGRGFYTGGGHTTESYQEPLFLQHILGGIQYATGQEGLE